MIASLSLRFLLPSLVAALAVGMGAASPSPAATIEADVEQGGGVVSDEFGFAQIGTGESAVVAVYLLLEVGELASTFEAGFDLLGSELVDVSINLGRVDPALAPLGVGTWTSAEANIVADQVRVSLLRENQGGDSLVVDIVITAFQQAGLFEVVLADRQATGDLDDEPFFTIVPIGTTTGTVLATIAVPEPQGAVQSLAALLALALAKGARDRCAGS